MGLSIKHPEADRLARRLAQRTGEGITEAILKAIRERLEREERKSSPLSVKDELTAFQQRLARLPVLDNRSPEDIIGYDASGLPS